MVPFPTPEAVTVSHEESLTAIHGEFEVTANVVLPEGYCTLRFAGLTVKVGMVPAWVTVTTMGARYGDTTVILAIRSVVAVFSV